MTVPGGAGSPGIEAIRELVQSHRTVYSVTVEVETWGPEREFMKEELLRLIGHGLAQFIRDYSTWDNADRTVRAETRAVPAPGRTGDPRPPQ